MNEVHQVFGFVLMCVAVVEAIASYCPNSTDDKGLAKPLYVLTLVPFPNPSNDSGWDRGLGTLPGALVAKDEINNRTGLLPGYHIELIMKNIEACSQTHASIGLNNLVKYTVSPPCHPVVAVAGLFCSSHTSILSPVAGHEGYDLIQLSAANSPIFHDQFSSFSHLWRLLGSGSVYVDATMALMDRFNWSRIAILYDGGSVLLRDISRLLQEVVQRSNNKSVIFFAELNKIISSHLEQLVLDIRDKEATVIFAALNAHQSTEILCKLAQKELIFPSYIWIRITTNLNIITAYETDCTEEMLLRAQQGHIELQIEDHIGDNVELVSGEKFSGYKEKYSESLLSVKDSYNTTISSDLTYSSLLYDQVWALALAINNSLPILKNRNLSIDHYSIGQQQITNVIEEQFMKLNFQGASGRILFNDRRGVKANIKIYQVNGSHEVFIGTFVPQATSNSGVVYNLSLTIGRENVPDDRLSVVHISLPLSVSILLFCSTGVVTVYITIILILLLYFRNTPEVKATSPYFSINIFLGCYLVCLSTILSVMVHFAYSSEVLIALTVTSSVLGDFGRNLYIVTLALKLLRILHIFKTWRVKCHLIWKDAFLEVIAVIISFSAFINVLLFLPGQLGVEEDKFIEVRRVGDVVEIRIAFVKVRMLAISISLSAFRALLLITVMIVAILSRKIDRKNFKDTKKVLFLLAFMILMSACAHGVATALDRQLYAIPATVINNITELFITSGVVTFLFLPKVVPVFLLRECSKCCKTKYNYVMS